MKHNIIIDTKVNEKELSNLSSLYAKGYRYVARDKDGHIYAYAGKPRLQETEYVDTDTDTNMPIIWIGGPEDYLPIKFGPKVGYRIGQLTTRLSKEQRNIEIEVIKDLMSIISNAQNVGQDNCESCLFKDNANCQACQAASQIIAKYRLIKLEEIWVKQQTDKYLLK